MNRDEEFGYIKGQLESIAHKVQAMEEEKKELSAKLDALTDELAMYRHFVVWIRSSLLIGAFILTMKWGDLMTWWNGESGE